MYLSQWTKGPESTSLPSRCSNDLQIQEKMFRITAHKGNANHDSRDITSNLLGYVLWSSHQKQQEPETGENVFFIESVGIKIGSAIIKISGWFLSTSNPTVWRVSLTYGDVTSLCHKHVTLRDGLHNINNFTTCLYMLMLCFEYLV